MTDFQKKLKRKQQMQTSTVAAYRCMVGTSKNVKTIKTNCQLEANPRSQIKPPKLLQKKQIGQR